MLRASPADSGDDERLGRIQQLIQSGDLNGARSAIRENISHMAGDPRIYNFLGVIEAQQNNFSAAESNLRRAIELAPRFNGAYLNLGRLYQDALGQNGRLDKALDVYKRLLKFEPGNTEAHYQAARVLNGLGNFEQSLEQLARLPAEAQQRAATLALQCANYAALARQIQARQAAEKLEVATDLQEADVLPILAALHEHQADELGARLLEALSQRGTISTVGLQSLAGLQEQLGHFKEARASLEKDLEFETPSAPLLIRLGKLAYQAGDLEGAVGYLAHARDLEPENAAIHFFFGIICIDLKLPPEAKKSLRQAVSLSPENPFYNYALGAVLLQEKNADEAIPLFQKYRDARPSDQRGNIALGVAYFDANQSDAAREQFESALQDAQTRLGANLYLARLALRDDNLAEAANRLNQAIAANPSSAEAYAELAIVHMRRNEFALAENDLNRALKIAPNHYRTNLNLLMLYQRTKDPRGKLQAIRVEELQKVGEEKDRLLLRSLEIRPY